MRKQKTSWFAGNIKPVHTGIYQRKFFNFPLEFSYWNGKSWSIGAYFTGEYLKSFKASSTQELPWRGLLK